MNLLQINNLSKTFGGLKAVNNVSFNLSKGIIKAIIGPNGAGKTTLFNLISGNISPDNGGFINFLNESIYQLQPHQIAYKGIMRTFQNVKLFEGMTVLENVMLGLHTKSKSEFFSCILNFPWTQKEEKLIKNKAFDILKRYNLEECAYEQALNLSFGKQRAVELARAIASEPTLILLDEPAAGLNIYETNELSEQILQIKENGITILVVEHDMSLVMNISDEILVLNYGRKIAEGTPHEIQTNQEVINIYLGGDETNA